MDSGTFAILGGAVALLLLSRRETADARLGDKEWKPALLSEYYPDAPPSQTRREGGKYDRNPHTKTLVITVQQHKQDRERYPYVSVSADLSLRGRPVPYGARVYFAAYPDLVFRLVDTGDNFRGKTKKIREPGHEPFDIATNYGSQLGFAGRKTLYWIDRQDLLPKSAPKVA